MTTKVIRPLNSGNASDGTFIVSVIYTDEEFLQFWDTLVIDPQRTGGPGDWVLTFNMEVEPFASQHGRRGAVCGLGRAIA